MQLPAIAADGGQVFTIDYCAAFLDDQFKVGEHQLYYFIDVDRFLLKRRAGYVRVLKQVIDKQPHPGCGVLHPVKKVPGFFINT